MRSTIPGRPDRVPELYAGPRLAADADELGVLVVVVVVLVTGIGSSGVCGKEAEAIPVRVMAPLVPEVLLVVLLGDVVDVKVVVLLGEVTVVVPLGEVAVDDIVIEDTGRGGPIDTSKWLVVV